MATIVDFPEKNFVFTPPEGAEDVILPLPCHCSVTQDGDHQFMTVTSCWQLSDVELAEVMMTGRVWLQIYGRQPPALILGVKPICVEQSPPSSAPVRFGPSPGPQE